MNLADQIESISRRAVGDVVDASRTYSETQRRLAGEYAEHLDATASAQQRLRHQLEVEADIADNATPRIMLPADVAEASPHRGASGE